MQCGVVLGRSTLRVIVCAPRTEHAYACRFQSLNQVHQPYALSPTAIELGLKRE